MTTFIAAYPKRQEISAIFCVARSALIAAFLFSAMSTAFAICDIDYGQFRMGSDENRWTWTGSPGETCEVNLKLSDPVDGFLWFAGQPDGTTAGSFQTNPDPPRLSYTFPNPSRGSEDVIKVRFTHKSGTITTVTIRMQRRR
jgi:hypothetical protein